jgi:hypothetical protein
MRLVAQRHTRLIAQRNAVVLAQKNMRVLAYGVWPLLPSPPAGYKLVVDHEGTYVVDYEGKYVYAKDE